MMKEVNKSMLLARLKETYPYASAQYLETKANKLLLCSKELNRNIQEWIEKKPLTDIKCRDKYSLNIVLKLRNDDDIPSAIIALNEYIFDASKEEQLWRKKR